MGDIFLDFSKNKINDEIFAALIALAEDSKLIKQRDDMIQYLSDNIHTLNISNGFHWVTHSQGAILARSVIQNLPIGSKIQIHTYISMAGPQMGQWGECSMNRSDIPDDVAHKMSRPYGWMFFYNVVAQNEFSFANYWHDPNHIDRMMIRVSWGC